MCRVSKRTIHKIQLFPVRLHDMMSYCERHGLQSVIGWVLGGRGFIIYDPDKLVEVLAINFGKTKYKSFIRQLHLWDFEKIRHGPSKGAYIHPYFVKEDRALCFQMNRKIKQRRRVHQSLPVSSLSLSASTETNKDDLLLCSATSNCIAERGTEDSDKSWFAGRSFFLVNIEAST